MKEGDERYMHSDAVDGKLNVVEIVSVTDKEVQFRKKGSNIIGTFAAKVQDQELITLDRAQAIITGYVIL